MKQRVCSIKELLHINAQGPVLQSYPPRGGHTVLMNAILGHKDKNNQPIIKLLLSRGADKYKTNAIGQNSIEFTQHSSLSSKKKKEVLKLLG